MDFLKLAIRLKQFGGCRLLLEYAKIGVLSSGIRAFFRCLIKGQSFKGIYSEVLRSVEPMLIERYGPIVQEFKRSRVHNQKSENTRIGTKYATTTGKRLIWFCWLQGLEQAPPIVRACYNSIKRHLSDRDIKVIDDDNWNRYVELPLYIVEKWKRKKIPAALFSDLLRLELLIKYGGTWIDSTVLCTGFQDSSSKFLEYLDEDLFLFQYTKQGSIPISISNWFITACSNNEVLIVLRDMLYAYWKDYDCTLDYYIFHLFFSMLSKEYPEEIKAMPYGCSQNSLVLLHHWGEKFDQHKWDNLISKVYFHKLAFRESKTITNSKGNYYNWIIKTYLQNEDI